jgi:hypothetical protein
VEHGFAVMVGEGDGVELHLWQPLASVSSGA